MKKLVHVSLLVLATVALISFVGCKNEPDPEPAPANFVGEWVNEDAEITSIIKDDGTFTTVAGGETYNGTYKVSGQTATASATVEGNQLVFTLVLKGSDTVELTLPSDFGGDKITLTKK